MKFFGLFNICCWSWRNVSPAMVLALTVATFPMQFALAGGRQAVEQRVEETLASQITGLGSKVAVTIDGVDSGTVWGMGKSCSNFPE